MPKGGKGKKQEREKKEDNTLGAYDAVPWDSSWSSSSTSPSEEQAKAFMEAFVKFTKDQDQSIPTALQEFFKQDVKGELKDQQKRINQHRAILQKIENKKKAIRKDEEQWMKWTQDAKEMIKKQKARHEEQEKKLKEELEALEKKEEALRLGKEEETAPINVDEEEEDVEALLEACEVKAFEKKPLEEIKDDEKINQKMAEMKKKLEAEYQQKFEVSCSNAHQAMQQQFQHQLSVQMMHMAHQFNEHGGTMLGPPVALPAEGVEGTAPAVGPFVRRIGREREAQSPYARNQDTMQKKLEKTHGKTPPGDG